MSRCRRCGNTSEKIRDGQVCPEHSTEELLQEHGEAYRDRVADYEKKEVQQQSE